MAKKPKLLYDEYSKMMEELYSEIEKETPLDEKFASKAQQKYFYWKAGQKGKKGKEWKKMADEFSDTMGKKDWKKLPEKVDESSKSLNPKMSKKSLVEYVNNAKKPNTFNKKDILKQIKENE
jgi:hypothetical protein